MAERTITARMPRDFIARWIIGVGGAWLTFAGIFGALAGMVVWVFLLVIQYQSPPTALYLGIFALAVMPGIVLGSIGATIGGGVLLYLEQRLTGNKPPLRLDLHDHRHVRVLVIGAVFGVLLGIAGAYDAFHFYEYVESTEFCGKLCHVVMEPEAVAHEQSPHANVHCATCHVGPGVEHFVRTKIEGMFELYSLALNKFPRPLKTPLKHLRPPHEICEQCHWPEQFHGRALDQHAYFVPDEENTRHNLSLVLLVGGEKPADPRSHRLPHSIHWHVSKEQEVYYIATDEQRQEIPYVKVVAADGKETVYLDEESEKTEEELLRDYKLRKMDCLDCHNRAVHQFTAPQRALNTALSTGEIDPGLPYVKREALTLLAGEYETTEQAEKAIDKGLRAFYAKDYPKVARERGEQLTASIAKVQAVYRANFFPAMKTDWKANPDNIGHMYFPGCFRCHQGRHAAKEGDATISHECATCHVFTGQGPGPDHLLSGDETFKHPEDIEGMWSEMSCTDCHTGAGTE